MRPILPTTLIAILASCSVEVSGSTALASGRVIAGSCDRGQVTLSTTDDEATVRMADRVFTVQDAQVLCDGAPMTAIPDTAVRVEIKVAGQTVSVLADGNEVHSGPLPTAPSPDTNDKDR